MWGWVGSGSEVCSLSYYWQLFVIVKIVYNTHFLSKNIAYVHNIGYNKNINIILKNKRSIMDTYTLYLDESETNKCQQLHVYAIGGIIINNDVHKNVLVPKIKNLKSTIWHDLDNSSQIILHEKEVKDATEHRIQKSTVKSEYLRFYNNINNCSKIYNELDFILRSTDLFTLGCVVIEESLHNYFPEQLTNDYSAICMQIIIENFCHFLYSKNAIGNIIYEAREDHQNTAMSQHFHQIKAIGSIYVNSASVQKYIKGIEFPSKQENIAGLQLADFIPNQIAKKSIGKKIYANTRGFNANIYRKAYDGCCGNKNRFGIRVIPKN